MSNILESGFKSILDNFGNPAVEFSYTYMCDDARKTSTTLIPVRASELTQEIVDNAVDEAEDQIKQRRND